MYIKKKNLNVLALYIWSKQEHPKWGLNYQSILFNNPANSHTTGLYQLIPIHGIQGRQLPIEW